MQATAGSIAFHIFHARGWQWKPAPAFRGGVSRNRRTGLKVLSALVSGFFRIRITCHKSQFEHIRPLYAPKAAKNGEILSYTQ
jgi:hypothetical protein